MGDFFSQGKTGLRARIRLTPKAGANRIQGLDENAHGDTRLKVKVTAAPEKNRANLALLRLLAKQWDVPRSDLAIVAGATSRDKILSLRDEQHNLAERLRRWQNDFLETAK